MGSWLSDLTSPSLERDSRNRGQVGGLSAGTLQPADPRWVRGLIYKRRFVNGQSCWSTSTINFVVSYAPLDREIFRKRMNDAQTFENTAFQDFKSKYIMFRLLNIQYFCNYVFFQYLVVLVICVTSAMLGHHAFHLSRLYCFFVLVLSQGI